MTAERYLRDPRHGQLVPQGTVIARLIGGILPSIQKDAAKQVRSGIRPNLSHWIDAIVNAAAPVIVPYWQRGYGQRSSDMLDSVRRRARRKSLFATASKIRRGFPVGGSVDISNYLKVAVFSFAQSTLDTVSDQIVDAIKATREALARSATAGETQEAINARLREIFNDEHRADRIGATESVRAYQAGSMKAAIDSGIVGSIQWLANDDCCEEICEPMNGKEVKLGTPFMVHNDGNPVYRVVMHPPAHPFCRCTTKHLLDLSTPIPGPTETHLEEMARKFREKPFAIKRKPRQYYGGWHGGWYFENNRRRAHPNDPLRGQWDDQSKPWIFLWDQEARQQ